MISRNGISIGVMKFPDRKKPSLCVQEGNVCTVVASFNSEEGAKYFKEKAMQMLEGMINEGDEDDNTGNE